MKNFYTSFLLFYAETKARRNYKRSYEICSKIMDSKNAKPRQKKTAATIIHKMIRKLTDEEFENYFNKINQMIDGMEDDFSMNSLLFNICISTAFYEKICKVMENSNYDASNINGWLLKADEYFIKSVPKYYDLYFGYLILVRLNAYLYLEKHEEIIDMCNDFLKKYTGSMLKGTKNMILFCKAKALARMNRIQEAYVIYQNIINDFSLENRLDQSILYHITHDYGMYFETINEYEKAIEYYKKSLTILNMMQDRKNFPIAYSSVSKRIKEVEKLLKS